VTRVLQSWVRKEEITSAKIAGLYLPKAVYCHQNVPFYRSQELTKPQKQTYDDMLDAAGNSFAL